jgi:hypothetical protein
MPAMGMNTYQHVVETRLKNVSTPQVLYGSPQEKVYRIMTLVGTTSILSRTARLKFTGAPSCKNHICCHVQRKIPQQLKKISTEQL